MTMKIDSPDKIFREFVKRANAGDVEGLVSLYDENATVYFSPDVASSGHEAIREAVVTLLEGKPTFSTDGQRSTIIVGDLALTSASGSGNRFTAEVAQRQSDGSWKWVIDHANFTSENYLASDD